MACLRRQALEGCVGTVQCDEEGCKLRYVATERGAAFVEEAPAADCVLQLRLRARSAENIDIYGAYGARTINWGTGKRNEELEAKRPKQAKSGLRAELEYTTGTDYNEIFKPMARGFVEGLRLHSISIDPVPLDPACTIQTVKHEHGHQYRGPRPNAVYLDEYQRWVGSWEDATDEEVLDEITNSVEKGNLTNHRDVDTKQHGPLDYCIEQTTRDARNHGLSERQLKEFFDRNGIDIKVYTKAGEWRSVGVHDLGEGVQSTDELPGSSRVDSSDQGEVQDGPVVSEAPELLGIIVDGLFVPEAGLHGYKDFGSRVWGRESHLIRGEN